MSAPRPMVQPEEAPPPEDIHPLLRMAEADPICDNNADPDHLIRIGRAFIVALSSPATSKEDKAIMDKAMDIISAQMANFSARMISKSFIERVYSL